MLQLHSKNDSRRASLTFTYRFGKPMQNQRQRKTGSATDEQNRVKTRKLIFKSDTLKTQFSNGLRFLYLHNLLTLN